MKPADDDQQDEHQDQHAPPVRLRPVALLGALEAEQPRRVRDQAPVEHVDDADGHEHLDRVACDAEHETQQVVLADQGRDSVTASNARTNGVITWSIRTRKLITACMSPAGSPPRNFFWPIP